MEIISRGYKIIMSKKIFVVGCGARGRVGKDLLAKCLFSLFDLEGYNCKIYSLANALKHDVNDFLKEKLNYDVWTNNTEEKAKFRDFLVWYGKQKRESSNGTYWTNLVEQQIIADSKNIDKHKSPHPFVAIVPDIRYSVYENDEDAWVQNNPEWVGKLIHVTRIAESGEEFPPLNEDEANNDPKIKDKADYRFTWTTVGDYPSSFYKSEHYALVKPLFNNLLRDFLKV